MYVADENEILATVKGLASRARRTPTEQRNAHHQIAKRRISDAKTFASKNADHATKCLWEAKFHLDACMAPL